jgi:TolB-like protein
MTVAAGKPVTLIVPLVGPVMPGQTLSGMLIGTPEYMSPEQARRLEVDHPTDLFSFGALLYELLSGTSPFAAGITTDIIVAILTREPPPLTKVPPAVAAIVGRALQKDRAQRYATAAELLLDLASAKQALGGGGGRAAPAARQDADPSPQLATAASTATPGAMTSLAVLPFANMSADVDNEHFCDGLAEELLNALSKIDALKVAARTSAFTFKGKSVDVGTIARTLGVTSVLDGSIRRSGNRLRISDGSASSTAAGRPTDSTTEPEHSPPSTRVEMPNYRRPKPRRP